MTHHADVETRPEKHIPVDFSQPLELTVHSPHCDVTVRAVDRPDVLIGYGSPGLFGDFGDEAAPSIDVHDNRIDVRLNPRNGVGWAGVVGDLDLDAVMGQITKAFRAAGPFLSAKPGKVRFGSGDPAWPDMVIEVPRSIAGRVEVHATSGDVRVEDFTGDVVLHAMSGDLRAVRTGGSLTLQAASGDLIVEDASGRLTARGASGDVRVTSAQFEGFEIQTANGDIVVDAMLAGDGPFHAQTASGDVRFTLRRPAAAGEEPAATLAFHTVSGDAHVFPPFRQTDRRRWRSGHGNGGPHLEISSVNGDLTAAIAATEIAFVSAPSPAVFADEGPSAPPAPRVVVPERPHSGSEATVADANLTATQRIAPGNPERLAVLEAVERGEIDIEEALRRLDAEDLTANS